MQNIRLDAISKLILPGMPIADIGSDHARLPLHLVESGAVPWAIASELGDSPYHRMAGAVRTTAFEDRISIRQGNGLEVLRPGEVSGVVIAGMGGDLMTAILSDDWSKAESFPYYLLQPMSRAGVLRKALSVRGWPIIDEVLIWERGQYYTIIHTRPGREGYQLTDLELELGPLILKGDNPLKKDYLLHFLNKFRKVHDNLIKSNTVSAAQLREDTLIRIERLEAIIDASQG